MPSPGAAFGRAFDNLLLQREQQERQHMLDELARKREERLVQAEIDSHQEHKQMMQERQQDRERKDHETKVKDFKESVSGMVKGDRATPEQLTQEKSLGLSIFRQAPPAMSVQPMQPPAALTMSGEGPEAGSATDVPAVNTPGPSDNGFMTPGPTVFPGTREERLQEIQHAKQQEYIQSLDDSDPRKQYFVDALRAESVGLKVPPSSAPKTASETMGATSVAIQKTFYDKRLASGQSPDEALVGARKDFNELQAIEAGKRQDVTNVNLTNRAEDAQGERATAAAYSRVMKDFGDLKMTLNRAGNLAESLAVGGGVGDATAAPEFLQMMAGGFGSGLRMTDTELNRINFAHSKASDAKLWLQSILSNRPPKLDENQREDMLKLAQYIAKREIRRAGVLEEGARRINTAKSAAEAREFEAELAKQQMDILGGASEHLGDVGATPPKSKYKSTIR